MALEPLRIIKNWLKGTLTREEVWDNIANPLVQWANRTSNNLKQIALDLNGITYRYTNDGKKSQTTPIITRIATLEAQQDGVGARNVSLDVSTQTKIKLVGSDGENLSATNTGLVTFNATTDIGELVTREITANLELTLTGTHWGFTGDGDLTDYKLWVCLIDTGSAVILGVAADPDRQTITTADDETAAGSVNSIEKVYVTTALSAENNCIWIGWVNAAYDDTGNAGGENFWTVQNAVGDINLGIRTTVFQGEVLF